MSDHDTLVELNIKVEQLEEDVQKLTEQVSKMNDSLTQYKGAIGGLMLAGSLIATAVVLIFQFLKLKATG